MTRLIDKIAEGTPTIRLYGLAPPKFSTSAEKLQTIAAQQAERLADLAIDGVVVYDIQDEAERIAEPRPFPFLPTVDPEMYAEDYLSALALPKIVYRCVNRDTAESFTEWLNARRSQPLIAVLVGAPSRGAVGRLSLKEAYALVRRHAPDITLGGVAIAERHARHFNEHERMLAKSANGCRFFVTQAVYDVTSTLSLLSDYSIALKAAEQRAAPVILTFSPCGSKKTLAFMKWLGIAFPRWLENELTLSPEPLETSMKLCVRIFAEVCDYARDKAIPLGVNVESVSIRKVEVEASIELARQLHSVMARSTPKET